MCAFASSEIRPTHPSHLSAGLCCSLRDAVLVLRDVLPYIGNATNATSAAVELCTVKWLRKATRTSRWTAESPAEDWRAGPPKALV